MPFPLGSFPTWLFPHVNTTYCIKHKAAIQCLNGTLSCVNFMDAIMGDIPNTPEGLTTTGATPEATPRLAW